MKKLTYKIKRICFDSNPNIPPYEEIQKEEFDTFEDAWNFAVELAEQEIDYLNSDCDDSISFGIPKDRAYEDKSLCRVEYYCNMNGDDTGTTAIVTKYRVYSEEKEK